MTVATARLSTEGEALTSLIIGVFRLNGRLIAEGDHLVASLGLTSARWQVLGALALAGTAETVADIARAMGLTRQSVRRIANELVEAGLLERADNPRHARADLMRLTVRGVGAYEAATRRQVPWANETARGIPARDLATAVRVVTTVSDRLFRRRSQRTESRRQREKKA